MCAPKALIMEPQSISTFSSTSTSRTLFDNDAHMAAPLSPISIIDSKLEAASPIVQTGDKQWIDLDYVSPKLLRELRRQYDGSGAQDKGALAKSAAKLKAYIQQSKTGFDLRLKRKVSAEREEITDVRLLRHQFEKEDERVTQLDSRDIKISELPDTPVVPELSANEVALANANDCQAVAEETLPRYERGPTAPRGNSSPRAVHQLATTDVWPSHRQHELLSDDCPGLTASLLGRGVLSQQDEQRGSEPLTSTAAQDLTRRLLEPGDRTATELRKLLRDLDKSLSEHNRDSEQPDLHHLEAVSKHETATRGAPSNVPRKQSSATRRPIKGVQRGRKRVPKANSSAAVVNPKQAEQPIKDEEEDCAADLAQRLNCPESFSRRADTGNLCSALLRHQSDLLGSEHHLCVQAEHASNLIGQKQDCDSASEFLGALRASARIATEKLGVAHPLVEAFAANLQALESLIVEYDRAGEQRGADKCSDAEETSPPGDSPCVEANDEYSCRNSHDPNAGEVEQRRSKARVSSPREAAPPVVVLTPPQPRLPAIQTDLPISVDTDVPAMVESQDALSQLWNSGRAPHQPRSGMLMLASIMLSAVGQAARSGIQWFEQNYGQEPPVMPGKVRVRWTCSCGEQLYDDFQERRVGAARELEAYLNRPRTRTGRGTPVTPSSSSGNRSFNSSIGGTPSPHTPASSYGHSPQRSLDRDPKPLQTTSSLPGYSPFTPLAEPPWLLTCANEENFAPKVAHLDMSPYRITSDKDLAKALRDHYLEINRKWKRLRLRGLTTIEFVQFECHQNRFADIRSCPDMPPIGRDDYTFEPGELMPPVGSRYLLHLFRHPEDYDGELITYLRAPKKQNGRLQLGVGWGINLVEGFLAERVWMLVNVLFGFISLVFGIAWACKKNDIQGAFGVAQWICALAIFAGGWLQAYLG